MNDLRYHNLHSWLAFLFWSILLCGFFYYDVHLARHHVMELARKEARANFETNQALRFWIVQHGGVYVPIDDKTPPNPALAHIPERDIQTPSGKKLTLMNSAYVLRQVMTDYGGHIGAKGKLTSLKLMNPANAPDAWEIEAIHQFESGRREILEFTDIDGEPYLRMMGAMLIEESCLKCHGFQGYKVGDVRGGFSLSLPIRPYLLELETTIRERLVIFGVIWCVGLSGILIWTLFARRRLLEKATIADQLQRQHELIQRSNTELTHFANISAHHLMEPSRRLLSYAQRLRERLRGRLDDDDTRLSLEYIEKSASRLRDLIRDIELYLAAGMSRGKLQACDPELALKSVRQHLYRLIADRHAQIQNTLLYPVYIDLPRLTDLLEVLLANALIHADANTPPIIRISSERLSSSVRMRIDDNGPGIAEEYRERVFGVFEQLRPNPSAGTGIGLAIARRIVESRNGKIWIESSSLGGIAVIFDLPNGDRLL